MNADAEMWSEALAIDMMPEDDASAWISERMVMLARAGDAATIRRFQAILSLYDQLRRPGPVQ